MRRGRPSSNNSTNPIVPNTDRTISFNYSENFNKVIELDTDNYSTWKNKMLYLLTINNITDYVTTNRIKKLRKRDVKENLNDYMIDKFDDTLVYDIGTSEIDIKNDITTKWMIINSLGEKTQKLIEGNGKTAYDIWKILQESFTKSLGRRKMELKEKLNNSKYDEDQDINIFIANLQNLIDELERIDNDMSDSTKVGILNRSLPDNLRFINVFQYKDSWIKCCKYVKNIVLEIIFSNLKESNEISINKHKSVFSIEYSKHDNNSKNNSPIKTNRKNGRCNYCGKKGHYFYECLYKKKILNKPNKSNKTKLKNKNKKFDKKLKRHNKKLNYKKNNRKYADLIENLNEHDKKYINTFNENLLGNISYDV